ncbi:MAG: Rossmann-fold NAD(P)-binding domain-containing protein, partial [Planctomycetota bacterium]
MSLQVLDTMARGGFEEVVALHDRASGLRAFLAIHDTSGGPARAHFWVMARESRRQSSSAWSSSRYCQRRMPPKMVILDVPDLDRPAAYRFIGRKVERLGGRFYTGPDVGTGPGELAWVAEETGFVTDPGDDGPGDLASATAEGVYAGIAAGLHHLFGEADWPRRTVLVQGLGGVGERLVRRLRDRGARVMAAEIDPGRAERVSRRLEVELVDPTRVFDLDCDVFAP